MSAAHSACFGLAALLGACAATRGGGAANEPAKRSGTSMPLADRPALRAFEDLGEVVKVVTDPGRTGFMALDERLRLELYVRRDALLPVLTAPIATAFAFDDGTSYVLLQGAVVPLEGIEPTALSEIEER